MRTAYLAIIFAVALGACASPGPSQRTTVSKAELKQLAPELTAHRRCVVEKVRGFLGGTSNVTFMVDTAIKNCRSKLIDVADGLDQFNLAPASKKSYLKAVENATRNKVNEALLKASASAVRKKKGLNRERTLSL